MPPLYTTKELSPKTWPDFQKLFTRGNGWDFCWCMHFQRARATSPKSTQPRATRAIANRRDKKELVQRGRAHGILVYSDGEPVGWCQYGLREELPRMDLNPNYRAYRRTGEKLWRITCFVVDKRYRQKGVGSAALEAALESIKRQGGGLVEAYPLIPFDQLRRRELQERGHASSFGNVSTHGTVSMFSKHGFKEVGPHGSKNVVMRKVVRGGA